MSRDPEGEPKGFHRRGLPNVELPKNTDPGLEDDERAFEKVAVDMQHDMEKAIEAMPELGIRQDEVDAKTQEFREMAEKSGLGKLEDTLEAAIRENVELTLDNKEEVVSRLALALAYLEAAKRPREEYLDMSRDD